MDFYLYIYSLILQETHFAGQKQFNLRALSLVLLLKSMSTFTTLYFIYDSTVCEINVSKFDGPRPFREYTRVISWTEMARAIFSKY